MQDLGIDISILGEAFKCRHWLDSTTASKVHNMKKIAEYYKASPECTILFDGEMLNGVWDFQFNIFQQIHV